MKNILLIDASSLIHRAFHALPPLTSPAGKPVGAIYGLANTLIKILFDIKPTHIAAAFDRKEPTFRKEQFEAYKAHRPQAPNELIEQFAGARELFEVLNIECFDMPRFEADDILGTLVKKFKSETDSIITILTGDLDTLQLVEGNKIVVRTFGRKVSDVVIYNERAVIDRFHVLPTRIPDYKGLVGDSSDNIPGVKGVGPKTAKEILSGDVSLEDVFEKPIKSPRVEKITPFKSIAILSKKLATIKQDVPILTSLEKIKYDGFKSEILVPYMANLGFESIVKRLGGTLESTKKTFKRASQKPDIDTSSIIYVDENDKEIIEQNNKTLIAYDWKNIIKNGALKKTPENIFDLGVAGWLVDANLSRPTPKSLVKFLGNGRTVDTLDKNEIKNNAFMLYKILQEKIDLYGLSYVWNFIEKPIISILSHMESNGIGIDKKMLGSLAKKIKIELELLEKNIYSMAGKKFNINSPIQIGDVLFDVLGLGSGHAKTTPKGQRRTNREVLHTLRGKHPIVEILLNYRENFKILSGFVEPLMDAVSNDGRVHTTFVQTGTATGRLSSENPNMQNIPRESKWSLPIRKTFKSVSKWSFVSFDYSQLELRLLAHLANEEKLVDAFNNGADIHTITASRIFNVSEKDVTPLLRRTGKTLNFGVVYGMGPRAFASVSGVSIQEAKRFIDNYFETFPRVRKWQDSIKEDAAHFGYIKNIHGRRRSFEHSLIGGKIRGDIERQVINMPIQSLGADIVKIAMKNTFLEIINSRDWSNKIRLLLSIHDELLFEVRDDILNNATPLLKTHMESVCKLSVPLRVDVKIGKNWGEMN